MRVNRKKLGEIIKERLKMVENRAEFGHCEIIKQTARPNLW